MAADGKDDEPLCRYCFGGRDDEDGNLISPCKCDGGQKWVHLSCLRRWQRILLVSQPTHPAFYEDDIRQHRCNVCLANFSCPPPTRHELMTSFTGAEIAALIEPACVIGARDVFSTMLIDSLQDMGPNRRALSSYSHWINGVYLITEVTDGGVTTVDLDDAAALSRFRSSLGDNLEIDAGEMGTFRVVPEGPLAGVELGPALASTLAALSAPVTITMRTPDGEGDCGGDHVAAVNLTRPIDNPPDASVVRVAMGRAASRYSKCRDVVIEHYLGGPCEPERVVTCVVPGGGSSSQGWTIIESLEDAIKLAHSRAVKRFENQGDIAGGQVVELTRLKAQPALNGEIGIALRFLEESGRWIVRLRNGEGKKVKPANLQPAENSDNGTGYYTGKVLAFWGDARWSRTQLLGEIARGHWGLCKASISDLAFSPQHRRKGLDGRLVFAPETEMTEEFVRNARNEMNQVRGQAAIHAQESNADDGNSSEETYE